MISDSHTTILWRQVWGVATILTVVLLSFTIYGIYQPKILKDLGFIELAKGLGIVQGVLGIVIEPLIGGWSDRILARFGSRLPLITAGITFAGLIFVIVAFLIQQQLPPTLYGIFPLLMTIWVMAMIAVRGPVAALLIQFAPLNELPSANAVVVLVLGLTGALAPLLNAAIQQVGTSIAFMIGAIALLIGGTVLYSTIPQRIHRGMNLATPSQPHLPEFPNRLVWLMIFGVGLGSALETNVLLGVFPEILQQPLPQLSSAAIASMILFIAALSANPLSRFITQWGEAKTMQVGLGAVLALMGLSLFNHSNVIFSVILIVAFGIAFGLVFTDTIPYALSVSLPTQAGLATGLYFSGAGAASATFAFVQQQTNGLTGFEGFWGAAIAFAIAHLCLMRSSRAKPLISKNL
ncbi:MAG: MFS transporter [Actinomycetota bacterium]